MPETVVGGTKVWNLRGLKDVVISEGVERIWNHWFWRSEIESVEIPASVKTIGPDAFYDCKNLVRAMLVPGSRLERIGAGSFYNTKIERMVIPKGVAEVQERTFSWCRSLKEVVFEEGSRLRTIGKYAFFQCNGLAKINLPDGVTSIGNAAFSGC